MENQYITLIVDTNMAEAMAYAEAPIRDEIRELGDSVGESILRVILMRRAESAALVAMLLYRRQGVAILPELKGGKKGQFGEISFGLELGREENPVKFPVGELSLDNEWFRKPEKDLWNNIDEGDTRYNKNE